MPVGQVAGEIVGTEYRHHAMRLVPQHGGGVGQRTGLLAGALAERLHRDRHLVDHAGHFGGRLPQRLAGFLADRPGQLVGAGLEGRSEALEQLDALLQRAPRPGREGLAGGAHGGIDLGGVSAAPGPDHALANRVEDSRVSPWPASHWPAM